MSSSPACSAPGCSASEMTSSAAGSACSAGCVEPGHAAAAAWSPEGCSSIRVLIPGSGTRTSSGTRASSAASDGSLAREQDRCCCGAAGKLCTAPAEQAESCLSRWCKHQALCQHTAEILQLNDRRGEASGCPLQQLSARDEGLVPSSVHNAQLAAEITSSMSATAKWLRQGQSR